MADPATIIILASTIASAGVSVASAQAQNKAAESSARVALRNRMEKAKRAQQAAALETQKTINEAQLVEGRIRVATSEMGTASSQTAVALQRQATSDAWTNIDINQQNLAGSLAGRICSSNQASDQPAHSPATDARLAASTGYSSAHNTCRTCSGR